MTAKQKVLEVYPTANARLYKNTMGETSHWLIWSNLKENVRLGCGKTKTEAWNDASKKVGNVPS